MTNNIELLGFLFLVWFCAFFLIPHIILFLFTSINQKMVTLEELEFKPHWNNNANVLSLESNYDEFVKGISGSEKIKKHNVVIKILKAMCDDVKSGKKYSSELYLSMMKNTYDRFFSIMLLFSFFPVLAIIIDTNGIILEDIYYLLLVQLLCITLVLLFNVIIKHKYNKFRELFLRNWYDKILNFDFIVINDIKNNLKNDSGDEENAVLPELMSKFIDTNTALNENLRNSTSLLTEALGVLCGCKQENKFVSYHDMIGTMQSGIEKIGEMTNSYEEITGNINTALSGINELASIPKPSIEAINKNASLLMEIRDKFSDYKEKAYIEELEHLKKLSSVLGDSVNSTFEAVEKTVNATTKKLDESYNAFQELCIKFNETYSGVLGMHQLEDALTKLIQENRKLEEYFNKHIVMAEGTK